MRPLRGITTVLVATAAALLVASCGGDSKEPAAPGSPSTGMQLPDGTYSTGELSRERLMRAGAEAGFTRAQVETALAGDSIGQVATFTLMLQDDRWRQLYDYGHDRGVGLSATYQVVDDKTLVINETCCGKSTFEYALDGDALTLRFGADMRAACPGDASCVMGYVVFQSGPFTKID